MPQCRFSTSYRPNGPLRADGYPVDDYYYPGSGHGV